MATSTTKKTLLKDLATQEVLARRRPSRIALGCSWIDSPTIFLHGLLSADPKQPQLDAMPLQNHKLH